MTTPSESSTAASPRQLAGTPNYMLRWVVLPYLYTSFLFYAVVQLQQTMLGSIYVTHQHVRMFGLLGTVVASVLYALRRTIVRVREPGFMALAVVYAAFVILDFTLKVARGTNPLAAAVYGETYLYFFVFFLPLVFVIADNSYHGTTAIVERGAFRALLYVAPPIFLLGFAQVFLNTPIVNLGDEAEGYAVEVYTRSDIGQVRAFSVFGSAFAYGHFITLIGVLAAACLLARRGRRAGGWGFLLLVSIAACASTLTRNAYLEFALSLLGVALIPLLVRRGWKNGAIVALSGGIAILSYGAMVAFFLLTAIQGRGLLNLSTFGLRLAGMAAVVARYIVGARGVSTLLLGQGYIQGDKFAALQGIHPLVFDNTYVDVALFSGLVGLVLYLTFFVRLFAIALTKYRQTHAYWWLALVGMYFSYPLVATLNIYTSQLYLITCMVMCYDVLSRRTIAATGSQPTINVTKATA